MTEKELSDVVGVPDEKFLTDLVKFARWYGWYGDYIEVQRFVEACFDKAGVKPPVEIDEPFETD